MKPQDILFVFIVLFLWFMRKRHGLVLGALGMIAASIPLFSFHIFFTAQRLIYYAVLLLAIQCIYTIILLRKEKNLL
jgi:hypothetical protein